MKAFLPGIFGKTTDTTKSAKFGEQDLAPGREIKGTVLEVLPGNRALVRLMGQTINAESETPLKQGQSLELVVEQTTPRLVLSLGGGQTKPASLLNQALGELLAGNQNIGKHISNLLSIDFKSSPLPDQDLQQSVLKLQDAVSQITIDDAKSQNAQAIRQALSELPGKAGLNQEALLAKGQIPADNIRSLVSLIVSRLDQQITNLAGGDPARAADLRQFATAAKSLGSLMEANAKANSELMPREASLLLLLPMLIGEGLDRGQLLFDLHSSRTEHEGGKITRMVFFLHLSGLGPLVIEAQAAPGLLKADFMVDQPDKARFLKDRLPELSEALGQLGYETFFAVHVQPAEELEQQSPLAGLIRQDGHYLSVTV